MSQLEDTFAEIVRRVIREELQSLAHRPDELLDADGVAGLLKVNKQKVYSLVREKEIEAIWISKREMRFAPAAVRDFQLKRGIKAA